MNTLRPSAYALSFNDGYPSVLIEAVYFVDERPASWAIRKGKFVMSKLDGQFRYEPLPSERDDKFYQEFRFKSAVDAEVAYRRFHN